jgi:hypothetical protein
MWTVLTKTKLQARGTKAVSLFGFFAAHGNTLEAFDFADELLDAGAQLVEPLGEEVRPVLGVAAIRDDRADAPATGGGAVGFGIVALVGDDAARGHVRADGEERLELPAVARLVAGEVEVERIAGKVALEVDLGAEPAARAAERLPLLPPFAPAAETWARIEVLSNICTTPAVRLQSASAWKNASNVPVCDNRQNRFQTLFQGPNSAGSARQVMLCSVK